MPVVKPRIRPRAVRAQQGAAVVASHYDQEAGDSGSTKFSPRRKSILLCYCFYFDFVLRVSFLMFFIIIIDKTVFREHSE